MAINRDRRRMLIAGFGAVGAVALARTARAGASCGDPGPLGPTGPTMRSLADKIAREDVGFAEARIPIPSLPGSATAMHVISEPGCYYLTGNLTGEPGKAIIEVATNHAEIECDGHHFIGVPGTRACIYTPNPQKCIGVFDGGFVDWMFTCIDLSNSTDCYIEECTMESCDASSNPAGLGMVALGNGGVIDDVNVLNCTRGSVSVGINGIVEETSILNCQGGGIFSPGPAVVEDNFVQNSDSFAIVVNTGGVIIGNRIVSAGGIRAGGDSVVAENDLSLISGTGILVLGPLTTVEENHISSGDTGIFVAATASSVLLDGNNIAGMTVAGMVIEASTRCLIVRNTVSTAPGIPGYSIAAGSSYGSIVNAVAAGDLGGSGTTLDPFSNFEY